MNSSGATSPSRFNADIIIGLVVIVFCAAVFPLSQSFIRDEIGPGPEFFPRALAGILIICSVILIIRSFVSASPALNDTDSSDSRREFKRVGITLALLIVYVILIPLISYVLSTVLYLALMMLFLGERRSWLIALWALGVTGGIYLLFSLLLKVPLPTGWFG